MSRRALRSAAIGLIVGLLAATGCAAAEVPDAVESAAPASAPPSPTPKASDDSIGTEESAQPPAATQADSCDWQADALTAPAEAPTGQDGDLHALIIGAWQHTHYDEGEGFRAIEQDIRYVFPAPDRLLYCQHVPGITDHAESRADFSWQGEQIVLPGPATGYTVTQWQADSMVWVNHRDDSRYLLQRR